MSARLLRDRVRDQPLDERAEAAATPSASRRQWQALHDTLVELGVAVELIEPVPGPARPGLHGQRGAGLSRTCSSARGSGSASARGRRPHFERWARDHGFEVVPLPEAMNFEGAGDALFCGETLFAGYRFRSDVRSHQWIGERLGVEVLPLELVDPRFYHLDTCFCPLAPDVAIYYPGAFDDYGRSVLERPDPAPDRGLGRGGRSRSVATPWWSAARSSSTRGRPKLAAALEDARLRRPPARLLRVHQVRRQRQVPDPAARRRGGGGLEAANGLSDT